MDESPKLAPMIASVLAAFAACAPVGAQAAAVTGSEAMPPANRPSQAAILAIESKAAEPDKLQMAFIRDSGPSWVQWKNQHKPTRSRR
jgi:hypothetical protein